MTTVLQFLFGERDFYLTKIHVRTESMRYALNSLVTNLIFRPRPFHPLKKVFP